MSELRPRTRFSVFLAPQLSLRPAIYDMGDVDVVLTRWWHDDDRTSRAFRRQAVDFCRRELPGFFDHLIHERRREQRKTVPTVPFRPSWLRNRTTFRTFFTHTLVRVLAQRGIGPRDRGLGIRRRLLGLVK